MYCSKCGMELREGDGYCSRCGVGIGSALAVSGGVPLLMLDKRNKKIAGVCAGFARYWAVDSILIRVIWLAVALGTGFGFIAYLVAWIVMPSDHGYNAGAVAITARPSPTC